MLKTTHTYKMAVYPKEIVLRDGTKATLKPMAPEDSPFLFEFFKSVPPEDRYFLKEDVSDPAVVRRWGEELDYDRALPLLAWHDGKVIADATLHRTRALARRHVGQIRIAVNPEYRLRGLGTAMLHELAKIANEHGVERLMLEVVADKEAPAVQAAEFAGFVKVGLLPGHVKDAEGHPRDLVILELPLGKWLEWWRTS